MERTPRFELAIEFESAISSAKGFAILDENDFVLGLFIEGFGDLGKSVSRDVFEYVLRVPFAELID